MGNPKPVPSMTMAFFLYAFLPFIAFVGLRVLEVEYGISLSDYMTWIPKKTTTTNRKTSSSSSTRNKKNKNKQKSSSSSPKQQGKQQKINIDNSYKVNDPRSRSKIEKPQKEEKNQNNKNKRPHEQEGNQDTESLYEAEIARAIAKRKRRDKMSQNEDSNYYYADDEYIYDEDAEDDEDWELLKRRQNDYENKSPDDAMKKVKEIDNVINNLRKEHKKNPNDIEKALNLAEALRMRDYNIHDGGSAQLEGINTYKHVIKLMTNLQNNDDTPTPSQMSVQRQQFLCGLHTNLGKMYFVANMFDRALECFDKSLSIDENEIDTLAQKGAVLYILGRFEDSANAYLHLIDVDEDRLSGELYSGLSKVLVADENAVKGGWDVLVNILDKQIPKITKIVEDSSSSAVESSSSSSEQINEQIMYDNLKRMNLAMFLYHDTKTKNTERAWHHLTTGWYYKMSILSPWMTGNEKKRVSIAKTVFHKDFWPSKIGSTSKAPIFIIGFVRCGSTLLERLLDAHPLIVGTGEDSVFNGRLGYIRNEIVEVSSDGGPDDLEDKLNELADDVVDGMKSRWRHLLDNAYSYVEENDKKSGKNGYTPKRFTDKMLSNYMNVGFINMLFPDALILHVVREPMDTIFSAYKHDFPPSALDYTCQFPALSELYLSYRDMMDHWENVLPGRITHVRYEDLVQDMPRIAPALIAATGLKWDPDVLNFHKKKHAVNTLSTHQVRQGVYSHHIHSWRRYEKELKPLVKLIGKRSTYNIKAKLPGYNPVNYM